MRTVIRAMGPIALVLACVNPAMAQTGAETLSEVISWLQANLGGAACSVFEIGATKTSMKQITENTEVLFLGCDMTLATSNTMGPDVRVQTYRIQLGKLNPAEVRLSEGIQLPPGWVSSGELPARTLRLVTTNGDKSIEVKEERYGDQALIPSEYKASEIAFHIRDQQTADKLAKSLTRAITLCGGK